MEVRCMSLEFNLMKEERIEIIALERVNLHGGDERQSVASRSQCHETSYNEFYGYFLSSATLRRP